MTLSPTNARLDMMIDNRRNSLRDLRSPDLQPYYSKVIEVANADMSERAEAIRAWMTEAGLTPVVLNAFLDQLGGEGREFFISLLGDLGVTLTFTNELIETDGSESAPRVLAEFAWKQQEAGRTLSISAIRERLRLEDTPETQVKKHLRHTDPRIYGDKDPAVQKRMAKMRLWLSDYFG